MFDLHPKVFPGRCDCSNELCAYRCAAERSKGAIIEFRDQQHYTFPGGTLPKSKSHCEAWRIGELPMELTAIVPSHDFEQSDLAELPFYHFPVTKQTPGGPNKS